MALRPTIYKFDLALSDLDRAHYVSRSLTVALHPSETPERMFARLVAHALHDSDTLAFGRGLSEAEDADLHDVAADGRTALWIDVGEPSARRIRKATRAAERVVVYPFTRRADVWWQKTRGDVADTTAEVRRLDGEALEALAGQLERTQTLSMTISGRSVLVGLASDAVSVDWTPLLGPDT